MEIEFREASCWRLPRAWSACRCMPPPPESSLPLSRGRCPIPRGWKTSVELRCDGEDDWLELEGFENWQSEAPRRWWRRCVQRVSPVWAAPVSHRSEIAGPQRAPMHTLIINGTECEPYITADDTLMQVQAADIVLGAEILAHILGVERILLAVEDNKPAALTAMQAAAADASRVCEVMTFPTKYPSGGEKQLIEILTGKQVPTGGLPADLGIVCQNPGTAVAVKNAICEGRPLTNRIVTVTGRALARPGNYRTRLGTLIDHLLGVAGFEPKNNRRLIHGGPMMGFALESADVPVIKTTNCILVPTEQELPTPPPAQACIRCGLCAEACPARCSPATVLVCPGPGPGAVGTTPSGRLH